MNKKQLFLLPFAGGNVYSFNFLKPKFSAMYDVIVLELPGRGKRMGEALLNNKEAVVDDYVQQVEKLRNTAPYVIYGHSMGALMGLLVTKRMEEKKDPPKELIVTGNAGPGTGMKKNRYLMNDEEFKKELIDLGGVPKEVLDSSELYAFFAPIMRADFAILEKTPIETNNITLQTPIKAIMGSEEETSFEIDNWKGYTISNCSLKILEGNHFFIYKHVDFLANTLIDSVNGSLVFK